MTFSLPVRLEDLDRIFISGEGGGMLGLGRRTEAGKAGLGCLALTSCEVGGPRGEGLLFGDRGDRGEG